MNKSVRYIFFTAVAAILVSSMLLLGLLEIYLATTHFRTQKERTLHQTVVSVTHGIRDDRIDMLDPEAMHPATHMAEIADATIFCTDREGRVVFTSNTDVAYLGKQVSPDILGKIDKGGEYKELGQMGGFFPSNYHVVGAAVYDEAGEMQGYMFAVSDSSELLVYLSESMSGFVMSAALVLLLAGLLTLFVTGLLMEPIQSVSAAAQKFSEGDYSARVPVHGNSELTQLAITFNEMANSFEATDESRRSFMGNIAHELRTPMTTIKGFVDGVLDGTISSAEQEYYLQIVSEEAGRLARLTQNMLEISRLEAGETVPNNRTFDIWGVIYQVFASVEKRIADKHLKVKGLEEGYHQNVAADEDYTYQVVLNLVDNAIKFTPPDGTITVDVKAQRGQTFVSICNTGIGLAPDEISQLFDRFYKTDKSRGSDTGSGLGLHICRVLTGLMGGRIWAESEEGKYIQITFTLPSYSSKKEGPTLPETILDEE